MKFQFKLLAEAIVEVDADTLEQAQKEMTYRWYHNQLKSKDADFRVEHIVSFDPNYVDKDFRYPQPHDQESRNEYYKRISPASWLIIALGVGITLTMAVCSPAKAAYCTQYDMYGNCIQEQTTTIYPTYPGSNARDYGQPGVRIERQGEDTTIYRTLPGSNMRDYSQPAYRIDR